MIWNDVSINSKWLHKEVKPQVEAILKELPTATYATLYLAQYYNDQATDEVQGKVIISEQPLANDFNIYDKAASLYPRGWKNGKNKDTEVQEFNNIGCGYFSIEVNYDMIETLQAYCKDNGDQNQDFQDNYTPFAKWTVVDGGIMLEVIGKIERPWLVGATREEEDY